MQDSVFTVREKASGNSKASKTYCAKNFLGAAKIASFSLYCVKKLLGTAKVERFTVWKKLLGAAKIARFSLYCVKKLLGTAKLARFAVPTVFLGAAKIARFSLYCVKKLLGTAKLARLTAPKMFLGAAKIARFSLYCVQKLLGAAKITRLTVPKNFWEQQRLQDSVFTSLCEKASGNSKGSKIDCAKTSGNNKVSKIQLLLLHKILKAAKMAFAAFIMSNPWSNIYFQDSNFTAPQNSEGSKDSLCSLYHVNPLAKYLHRKSKKHRFFLLINNSMQDPKHA